MKQEERFPVFNIDLNVTGWRGPFESFREFRFYAGLSSQWERFTYGACSVMNDGRLSPLKKEGLHKYVGDLELVEDDHIHLLDKGEPIGMLDVRKEEGEIYLMHGGVNPVYTLDGLLYARRPTSNTLAFLAIADEIRKHSHKREGEVLEELSLGELKEVYRQRVSDQ